MAVMMKWELEQFEACGEKGFIHLDWTEGTDEITGIHAHSAWVLGHKIVLHVSVIHVIINPATLKKKYRISLMFRHKSPTADIRYYNRPDREELDLEWALEYAAWQATLIFRLIEGEDATPLPIERHEPRD